MEEFYGIPAQTQMTTSQMSNAPFDKIQIKSRSNIQNSDNELVDIITGQPAVQTQTISTDNKWIAIKNPSISNKILLKNDNNTYSGSGLVIFEIIDGRQTIVLVKSKRGVFEDFGGEISKDIEFNKDTLKINAVKETIEESQGVYYTETDLDSKNNKFSRFVDIEDESGYKYRCYFLSIKYETPIPDIRNLFMQNKSRISTYGFMGGLSNDWYETLEIGRFDFKSLFNPISKLEEQNIKTDLIIFNVNGEETNMKIRNRTAKALYKLYKSESSQDMFDYIINNPQKATIKYNPKNGITYISI